MQQEPPVSGGSYCHIVKPINNPQLLQNLRQTIQPFLRREYLGKDLQRAHLVPQARLFYTSSDALRSFCIRLCAVLFCSSRNSSMERVFSSFLCAHFCSTFSSLNIFDIVDRLTLYFFASERCDTLPSPATYSAMICFL